MRIAVVDGQGGGLGKYIVDRIRKDLPDDIEIIALGTNAMATAAMLKSGANEGATGENAVVYNADKVDIIIGTMAIISANSMLGELTPKMAEAIGSSKAAKLLLPISRSGLEVIGCDEAPLPHLLDKLIARIESILNKSKN